MHLSYPPFLPHASPISFFLRTNCHTQKLHVVGSLGVGAYLPDLTASLFKRPKSYSPWGLRCYFHAIHMYNAKKKTMLVFHLL